MFKSLEQLEIHIAIVLISSILVLLVVRYLVLRIIYLFARSKEAKDFSFDVLRRHYFPSLYLFLALFLYDIAAFSIELEVPERLFNILTALSFTWVMARTISLVSKLVYRKFTFSHRDNIRERKIQTQAIFLERLLVGIAWIVGISMAFLNVEEVKGVGNKLLASAGIASVVVGFAAQKGLANLIAGFTIAFTQPIRLDDVVIVENEWGRIEDITLTYVVVRLWDQRRMVLPVTYFTQNPFQNWTRSSSELLGNITFWTDYTLNVAKLRQDAKPVLEGSELFNGDFWNVQVVDTNDKGMQVRMLMTANDSQEAWDLRCEMREKILELIRETQPQALPRFRIEGDSQ